MKARSTPASENRLLKLCLLYTSGEKGYPYFRNRCFIMARAGTDEATVAALKELYGKILADEEVAAWLQDTMLLEVDPMSQEDVDAHVENVKNIVNEYKDIVAG